MQQIILAAFPTDALPPLLVAVNTYDDEGLEKLFRGRRWSAIPTEDLLVQLVGLSFFTPEAFAYYLPALMSAAVSEPDSNLMGDLCNYLRPPKNDPCRPSYAAWWFLLTPEQRNAVVSFLRFAQAEGCFLEGAAIVALEKRVSS